VPSSMTQASVQPVVSGAPVQSAPTVQSFGQTADYAPAMKGAFPKSGIIFLAAGTALLLIILLLYFWFLPAHFASQYLDAVKQPYQQQSAQLPVVYDSLHRKVFSSTTTSSASNNKDIAYINGVLRTAQSNTDALKAKNHLTVLPGTAWVPA